MTAAPARVLVLVLSGLCAGAAPGLRAQPALAPPEALAQIAADLNAGHLDRAKAQSDALLPKYAGDPTLQNLAGVIAAQRGDVSAAEHHLQTAIRLAPRDTAAYENLGRVYLERSADPAMRARGIATYGQILAIDPAHADALFQSAFLLLFDRQYASSRALLDRLPAPIRQRPPVLAIEAMDRIALGDAAGAMRAAGAVASHPDLAEDDVVAILPTASPPADDDVVRVMLEGVDRGRLASPAVLLPLAAIYNRGGRFADARAVLERVAAAGPTAPILLALARTAARQKDFQGALGYLAHARSLAPDDAAVHFAFGIVCVELNLGREAFDALKKAVELDPDNPMVNYAMGAVATHRHEPSESLPYFEKYVRLRPDDPRAHFALGAARFYSNQFDEARAPLERAARSPETATGAHYFLGRIARQANDLETARREIEQALAANAGSADAWAELGLIQTRTGQYVEAERSLDKALALEPQHYAASVNLATLYARTKDPRREAQAAKVAALLEQREARAQEFLRIVEAVP